MKKIIGLSSEKGQSAVEFALVLPLLLVLLLGIIEFGWFLNAKITITGAAREGARYLAIHEDSDLETISDIVEYYLNPSIVSSSTVEIDKDYPVSGVTMAYVKVTGNVKGITGAFTGLMSAFFGSSTDFNEIAMVSEAFMRVEYSIAVASQ